MGWTPPPTRLSHTQLVDVTITYADVAQDLDLAQTDRVRRHDAVLVHIQTDKHSAIVFHADLRGENR
jgi:hypothetical protein